MDSHCIIEGCENPIENRDTKLCASHSAQKRKAAKEELKVKIVKPPRKVSAKKAIEVPRYSILKQKYLEFKMGCEALLPGCTISATEIHHCSKSETNFLNMETWLGVCPSCHRKLEDLPAEERRAKGWLTD